MDSSTSLRMLKDNREELSDVAKDIKEHDCVGVLGIKYY